jgi:hypothetical protein
MKPHKHAELIKAWADGATIERLWNDYNGRVSSWLIDNEPDWSEFEEYRIKPIPVQDPKPKRMYLYFVGSKEKVFWISEEPPETYLYRTISDYIGSIEVFQ